MLGSEWRLRTRSAAPLFRMGLLEILLVEMFSWILSRRERRFAPRLRVQSVSGFSTGLPRLSTF